MKINHWVIIFWVLVTVQFPINAYAILNATLEQISPDPANYSYTIDFERAKTIAEGGTTEPALGKATGLLEFSGLGTVDDFSGFTPGNIALIERGGVNFSTKVNNAWSAGAMGAIIFDNNSASLPVKMNMVEQTFIPSLFIIKSLGVELRDMLNNGDSIRMYMNVGSPFPWPMFLPSIINKNQ